MNRSLTNALWAACLLLTGAPGGSASLPGHAYAALEGTGPRHGSALDPDDGRSTGASLLSIDLAPQTAGSIDFAGGENASARGYPGESAVGNPPEGGWLVYDDRAPGPTDPSMMFRLDSLSLVELVASPSGDARDDGGGVGVVGATPIGYPSEGIEFNNVPLSFGNGGLGPDWLPTHVTIGSVTIRFFHRNPSSIGEVSGDPESGRLAVSQAGLLGPLAVGVLGLILAVWGVARRWR